MLEHILGVPAEQVLSLPSVRLVGDRKVEVCNYKGLLQVGAKSVRIATSAGNLVLEGSRLEVAHIAKEYLTVRGCIQRIYYEERL
jgi:sporulation protein YqfC